MNTIAILSLLIVLILFSGIAYHMRTHGRRGRRWGGL